MRWPLVSRKRLEAVEAYAREADERRRQAAHAAARLGHRVVESERTAAALATELRLLAVAIKHDRDRQVVCFQFEIADLAIQQGYRYGAHGDFLRSAIAHHVEELFMRDPDTRALLR